MFEREARQLVLIYDNCNTRKIKSIWPRVRKHLSLINTPAYTPQFSIVEYTFSYVKSKVRKQIFTNKDELFGVIKKEIDNMPNGFLANSKKEFFIIFIIFISTEDSTIKYQNI
jgi:hypothetical protein